MQKNIDNLKNELNELRKRNNAISVQFDEKNIHIDKLNDLIKNIKLMLIFFITIPSVEEKNCIQEIFKYINNNYKE